MMEIELPDSFYEHLTSIPSVKAMVKKIQELERERAELLENNRFLRDNGVPSQEVLNKRFTL